MTHLSSTSRTQSPSQAFHSSSQGKVRSIMNSHRSSRMRRRSAAEPATRTLAEARMTKSAKIWKLRSRINPNRELPTQMLSASVEIVLMTMTLRANTRNVLSSRTVRQKVGINSFPIMFIPIRRVSGLTSYYGVAPQNVQKEQANSLVRRQEWYRRQESEHNAWSRPRQTWVFVPKSR